MTRLELVGRLLGEYGQKLEILPWWREALERLDDPDTRELLIRLPRQAGKSQLLAAMAVSEILTRPGSSVLYIAASRDQAQAVYARKIRRPLERLFKGLSRAKEIRLTKRGIEIPGTGAALEVLATDESTVPGRSPLLLIFDEARDIPDDVYTALAPSAIGAGGTIVVASTAGPPRGFFYELVRNPAAGSWLHESNDNDNPYARQGVVDFLKKRFGFLSPAARLRELENQFAEDGDEFLPGGLVEAAVDDALADLPGSPLLAYAFLDLSRRRDLTSRTVVVRDRARRPEARDHLVAASVRVWDPRQSPTGETDFALVRADLAQLVERFPNCQKILVDEGAEAGSILPWARAHPALTLRVEGFQASVKTNMDLWGALAARLHGQTLSIPRHERLIAELKSLRQEGFTFGTKWRVVDSSKKLHRDVSVTLAGACFAAGEQSPCPFAPSPCPNLAVCPVHSWGGNPHATDAEEAAAEERERKEQGAEMIKSAIARDGMWWPGGR